MRITTLGGAAIARGAVASIVIRTTAIGLGFIQAVLTARLLGPEGYGIVAVALSVATVAATLSVLGLGPLAVRELARLVAKAGKSGPGLCRDGLLVKMTRDHHAELR